MTYQGTVHTRMSKVREQFASRFERVARDFKVRVDYEKVSFISTKEETVICAPVKQERSLSLEALFSEEVPLYLWYFSLSEKRDIREGFYLSWFDFNRRASVLRHQSGDTRYRRGSLTFRGDGAQVIACAGAYDGGVAVGCCTTVIFDHIATACLTIDLNDGDVDVNVDVDPID